MGFTTYQARRQIHLGQIRRTLQLGDTLDFDGSKTRIGGIVYDISTMSQIIGNGWLTEVGATPPDLPMVAPPPSSAYKPSPKENSHSTAPKADQELNTQGERISFAAKEARTASGKRPSASQKHVWELDLFGNGNKTCKVCGVTERNDLIRADRVRGDGRQQRQYVDAHGVSLMSFEELDCPLYLGDPASAAALAKDQVRKVRGRVDDVEVKVENVEERLARLEIENEAMRAELAARPALTQEIVLETLMRLAAQKKTLLLPEHLEDFFEMPDKEAILVDAEELLQKS